MNTLRRLAILGLLLLLGFGLVVLAAVARHGGFEVHQPGWGFLTTRVLHRPICLALLSLFGLLQLLAPRRFAALFGAHGPRAWAFLALLLTLTWLALDGRPRLRGDGKEYLLQTQALALHGALRIDPEALRGYWNRTNPFHDQLWATQPPQPARGEFAQSGGGFGGLYADRFGVYRYYHFWAYPLAVAPLYALLHHLVPTRPFEYQAFRLMNLLFLALPWLVAWRLRPSGPLLLLLALTLFTPLLCYVDWSHPELFCFSLIALSFQLLETRRGRKLAPALLGLAAAQNPPALLFFPLHLWLRRRAAPPAGRRAWLGLGVAYGLGALLALSAPLYCRYYFGTWNLIASLGLADFAFASGQRWLALFVSPLVGALWFFPACFLFLPAAGACGRRGPLLATLGAVAAAAWWCTATSNFHSAQIGAVRYAVWLLAPLWVLIWQMNWGRVGQPARLAPPRDAQALRWTLFGAGLAATLVIIFYFQTWRLALKEDRRFADGHRLQPETAALMRRLSAYREEVETLTENILGGELPGPGAFNGVYIWNLSDRASLWVVSQAALEHGGLSDDAGTTATAPLARHPLLGGYRLRRVDHAVPALRATCPVVIR